MIKQFYKYLILIITFQEFVFPLSYNVFGIVSELDTEEPIKNVVVFIKNQNTATITDENGYFNFLLTDPEKNNFDLSFELIGYENKLINVNLFENNKIIKCNSCYNLKLDLGNIFLNIKSIDLELVQIESNTNKSSQISDINIAGLELNESLKGNLATTLSNYPNIGINSFGVAASKPSLRGFSGDRFLVTKDGVGTGDLSQSSIDHAIALDMSEVSEIEIIRGPKSLIYGPNTIGGVINTTMLGNPATKVGKLSTKVLFGSESFSKRGLSLYNQGLYGSLFFYIPIKNNQLNISFSNRDYENQASPFGTLENTNSETKNYKIGFTHYTMSGYINFIAENFKMDYGIPPTTSGHNTGIDIPMLKKTYQINYQSSNNLGRLNLKYNLIDYQHMEIIPDHPFNDYELLLSKKTQNFKAEINSNNFLFGSEVNIKNFKSDGINETPITDGMDISLYGFYENNINSKFDFLSSFRFGYFSINPKYYNYLSGNPNLILTDENCSENYEYCDDDNFTVLDADGNFISLVRDRQFNNLSFSLGVRKKVNNIEFNSWLMHTMRAPRVEELYSDGPHLATYAFEIGNPNLKSERIYGVENSISFNSNPLEFSLVTFYNYSPYYFQMTRDGICEEAWGWDPYSGNSHPCNSVDVPGSNTWIDWGSAPLGWLYIYSPKGNRAIIKGFEFDFGYQLKDFKVDYNLSFVQGDDLTLGLPLSYISPMREILSLNFDKNFMNLKLRFSKIHPQDRLGEFETFTPGALLTDLVLSYNHKNYDLTIQLNNIFNKEYYNHLSRIKSIMPEPGRNIILNYKRFF